MLVQLLKSHCPPDLHRRADPAAQVSPVSASLRPCRNSLPSTENTYSYPVRAGRFVGLSTSKRNSSDSPVEVHRGDIARVVPDYPHLHGSGGCCSRNIRRPQTGVRRPVAGSYCFMGRKDLNLTMGCRDYVCIHTTSFVHSGRGSNVMHQ